jgi:hypothetical protein
MKTTAAAIINQEVSFLSIMRRFGSEKKFKICEDADNFLWAEE